MIRAPTLLADVLARPMLSRGLVALGLAQVGLFTAGFGGWSCPIRAITGVPCPGCGLTHSLAALARGDWAGSLAEHPLGPAFAAVGVLLVAGACLPPVRVRRLAEVVGMLERRWWIDALFLMGVFVAWGWRLYRVAT